MIYYPFSLGAVVIILGILKLAKSVWALRDYEKFKTFALGFHRHDKLGQALFCVAGIWTLAITVFSDLMEYSKWRPAFVFFVITLVLLTLRYLKEYLSVRSAAILMLLVSKVILDAAYLCPNPLKIIIVLLTYLAILWGMTLVCIPYLARDLIKLFYSDESRARSILKFSGVLSAGMILFGIMLLF